MAARHVEVDHGSCVPAGLHGKDRASERGNRRNGRSRSNEGCGSIDRFLETRWGGEEEVLEARVVAGCSGERREAAGSSLGRHGRWWMGWIGGRLWLDRGEASRAGCVRRGSGKIPMREWRRRVGGDGWIGQPRV